MNDVLFCFSLLSLQMAQCTNIRAFIIFKSINWHTFSVDPANAPIPRQTGGTYSMDECFVNRVPPAVLWLLINFKINLRFFFLCYSSSTSPTHQHNGIDQYFFIFYIVNDRHWIFSYRYRMKWYGNRVKNAGVLHNGTPGCR